MKILNKISLFLAVMAASLTVNAQSLSAPLWVAKNLPVPESVLYDASSNLLYVSLIDGVGNVKDGKGGIAVLNTDGTVRSEDWVTGLNAPKGLARFKDKLYVADLTAVVTIDIKTGKIVHKLEIEGAVFLNDLTVDKKGTLYVSDTRTNKVYRIKNDKYSLYLDNVSSANGLKWIKNNLYILANTELWKVDVNKKIDVIAKGFEKSGDGLEQLRNGDFLVTCWAGLVYYVKPDGRITKMQDVVGSMNTADLGYNERENIIYIPTFNSNTVIAYRLNY